MKKKKYNRDRGLIFFSILFIFIACILLVLWYQTKEKESNEGEFIAKELDLDVVKENYHDFVKVSDGAKLYVKDETGYQEECTLYGEIEIQLDPDYEIIDKYLKVLESDYYIAYDMVTKIESFTSMSGEYKYYKNYIPYNENVELKDGAKLYLDDSRYYEVSGGSYPVYIKDTDRFGIEYLGRLVYVSSEDVLNVVESTNTDKGHTDGIGVLNYHYVVNKESGELNECVQEICITDTMFESHLQYLQGNNYYAVSMRDLELFIDGKIQLPEKSVSLTFDDGWYMTRAISLLEKYQMLGTLFLIGSLASPEAYISEYLEVHSHTWDMHTMGQCPSNVGRGGILCLDDNTVLEDLKKSRESLNQTTYFCYPFYDYNQRAIELLQQAGFTMAFAGELRDSKVRVGQNKFKIPRYVIVNYTTMDNFIRYVS